jgi:adenylyltransferase/sulfurtransferase
VTSTSCGARPAPLVDQAATLDPHEMERYSRHILLPEIGVVGQRRLKNARVLVIGAGGLGSPVLLYLAAAGVGTIGIVDDDTVDASNLQRQVIHGVDDIGRRKVDSARDAVREVNPLVRVETHPVRLVAGNAESLFARYDLIVDGADNFATRYLVSDAAAAVGAPCVWGSVLRFGAQVSVFWKRHGPAYRDLYPDEPPIGSAPSCGEAGVFGMLCGVAGSMMAAEAVKLITGTGRSLLGRLSIFDLADATWRELQIAPDTVGGEVRPLPACGPASVLASEFGSVTVHALREALDERSAGRETFELIDVREAVEHGAARIPGSRSVPLSGLATGGAPLPGIPADRLLVIHCKAGPRAQAAAEVLRAAGYTDIRLLTGGMDEWLKRFPAG